MAVRSAASALLRPFQSRSADPRPASSPRPEPRAPILLVSARETDLHAIENAISGSRYVVVPASLEQAATLLSHVVFPIILYDCRFPEADWKQPLARLVGAWRSPSIILLAETCSREFWEESICRGAFDVLTPPFQPDKVLVALDFAYTNWKLGLTRRTPPRQESALAPLSAACASK